MARALFVRFVTLMVVYLLLGLPAAGAAESPRPTGHLALEGHTSLFSDVSDRSVLAQTFGYALRGGLRWSRWGLLIHAEHNLWRTSELEDSIVAGAVNLGVGGELIVADGFVASSVVVGTSILAYETLLDEPGTAGLFFELRPVGLRFNPRPGIVLCFDPLVFSVVAPVLTGVPLIFIQYRTIGSVEVTF